MEETDEKIGLHEPTKEKPENTIIGGFVRGRSETTKQAIVSVEGPRPDEMKFPDKEGYESRVSEGLVYKRTWRRGQIKGGRRKSKLAVMGIPSESLDAGNQDYARCVRLSRAYQRTRTRELLVSHGWVSSGVSSLLSAASLALAASRYLYQLATQTPVDRVAEILKKASSLADSHRQNELAAWELCAREATSHRKMQALSKGIPWLVNQDEGKPKIGRPKSGESEYIDLPPIGTIDPANLNEESK